MPIPNMVGHILIELQHIISHTCLVDINECKHYMRRLQITQEKFVAISYPYLQYA